MTLTTKDIFKSVRHELINIHIEWVTYNQVYGSEKRIELLNDSAPNFFFIVQNLLLDNIALSLSKLTDPASSFGKDNLSISQLIERIDDYKDIELKDSLELDLTSINDKCKKFRKHRNKRIAHTDLNTRLRLNSKELTGFTTKEIEEALESIRNLLNKVEYYFFNRTTLYEEVILPLGSDGSALIKRLIEAHTYKVAEIGGLVERGMWKHGEYKDV